MCETQMKENLQVLSHFMYLIFNEEEEEKMKVYIFIIAMLILSAFIWAGDPVFQSLEINIDKSKGIEVMYVVTTEGTETYEGEETIFSQMDVMESLLGNQKMGNYVVGKDLLYYICVPNGTNCGSEYVRLRGIYDSYQTD